MLFNSFEFLIFFPLVTIAYFILPHRYRWILLLGASAWFYMAFIPKYILILCVTILVDYFAGLGLEKFQGKQRRWLLILSIVVNVGMLAFFKYFNFVNGNLADLAHALGWNYSIHSLKIILPIGLSFHTFQSLSYTIEVYRGHQKAERHLGYLALYVLYYPQLVAGPIERPQNVLHQFHTEHKFEYQRVANGLKWMAWGLFKKIAVADRLVLFVNPIYAHPEKYEGPALVFATLAFAIQIYCDFSGYSDIALGSSQVMGIKLMKNFDHPYFSSSIAEFWRRWHISLSTWFRDYLYIPMGGNRVSKFRWAFNIMITFLISGLWHGANWTYMIWGGLHGFYFIATDLLTPLWNRLPPLFRMESWPRLRTAFSTLMVFLLVSFAWIFFRAESLSDAMYIVRHLGTGWEEYWQGILLAVGPLDKLFYIFEPFIKRNRSFILLTLLSVLLLFVFEGWSRNKYILEKMHDLHWSVRGLLYSLLVFLTLIMGTALFEQGTQFIYFQF